MPETASLGSAAKKSRLEGKQAGQPVGKPLAGTRTMTEHGDSAPKVMIPIIGHEIMISGIRVQGRPRRRRRV